MAACVKMTLKTDALKRLIYLSNDQKGLSVILLPLIWKNPLYILEPFFGSSALATSRKERAQ